MKDSVEKWRLELVLLPRVYHVMRAHSSPSGRRNLLRCQAAFVLITTREHNLFSIEEVQ